MTPRRLLLPALLAGAAFAGVLAGPASAQQDDRRMTDLQRQVRELRAIVFQGRDTGQPVEVKPVGPDPQVVALQSKVDGMAEAQRQLTGQNEVLQHDLDETRRTAENNRAEAAAYRAQAEARLARLEAQVAAQAAPPPAAPADPVAVAPPAATLPPVVQPPSGRPPASRRAQELTARTQAGDTSRFGEPVAPPAAAADPFADAYAQYRKRGLPRRAGGVRGLRRGQPRGRAHAGSPLLAGTDAVRPGQLRPRGARLRRVAEGLAEDGVGARRHRAPGPVADRDQPERLGLRRGGGVHPPLRTGRSRGRAHPRRRRARPCAVPGLGSLAG